MHKSDDLACSLPWGWAPRASVQSAEDATRTLPSSNGARPAPVRSSVASKNFARADRELGVIAQSGATWIRVSTSKLDYRLCRGATGMAPRTALSRALALNPDSWK